MPSPHPTNPPGPDRPTTRQLRLLRQLAQTCGQTFTYPHTKREAHREIQRLLDTVTERPLEHVIELRVEAERLQRDVDLPADATAIREDETEGYGAHAHWKHTRHHDHDGSGS